MNSCKKHVRRIGNGLVSLAESGGIESQLARTSEFHKGLPKSLYRRLRQYSVSHLECCWSVR